MIVVDSGVLISSALSDEPLHNYAIQALFTWQSRGVPLAAPQLLRSEVTAVIRKAVYQKRITHQQGRVMLSQMLIYPIQFVEDDALLERAYDLANQFNRPRAYDTQYMALAERLNCEFWTADAVLVNAVQTAFTRIRWLGSFNPSKI